MDLPGTAMIDEEASTVVAVTRRLLRDRSRSPGAELPVRLLTQAIRRLQVVVGLIVMLTAIGWIGVNALEGEFLDEFRRPGDWIPPTVGLAASLAVFLLTRSSRFSVLTILKVGLAYEVLVSYGMAAGQYWDTFHDLAAILGDRQVFL